MKIIAVVVGVLMALIATAAGLKNKICGLPHSQDGDGIMACMALFTKWSYNADANECVLFEYGGCGGNNNQFETQSECEKKCKE